MAIDEALLSAFDPQRSAPVLRLYGWDPPALSLGRFQDADSVLDLSLCRARRMPVVRRITGGGVVYHADELTYSIVLPPRLLAEIDVEGSYRSLNRFLLDFYGGLGLPASFAADESTGDPDLGRPTDYCFAGREPADILVGGRKIGGNAQRRTRNALFQHGSIPLADRSGIGIGFLRERPRGLDGSITDLATLGISLPRAELKDRLASSFERAFGTRLAPSGLSGAEEEQARERRSQPPR